MGRAPCCDKVGLKRGRWTSEEDAKLSDYILRHGEGSWRSLPKNAGLLRCGKSCRLRWMNYLRSELKRGNITSQEEDVIIRLHATLGNRWSTIARHLPGRTDNEIKNYWNSHLSRRVHTFRRPNGEEKTINLSSASAPPRRRGCRTSRATMQKNETNNITTNNNITNPNLEGRSAEGKNAVFDKEKEMFGVEDIMKLDGLGVLGPNEVNGLSVGPIRNDEEQCSDPNNNVSISTSSNGGESTSSSSRLSWLENGNWNMENGMVDDLGVGLEMCSEKEQIISWLWENDEGPVLPEVAADVDYEREQAMVAWLLS